MQHSATVSMSGGAKTPSIRRHSTTTTTSSKSAILIRNMLDSPSSSVSTSSSVSSSSTPTSTSPPKSSHLTNFTTARQHKKGLMAKLRQLINESMLNGRFNYRWQPPKAITNNNSVSVTSASSLLGQATSPTGASTLTGGPAGSSTTTNNFSFTLLKLLLPYQSLFTTFPNSPFIVLDKIAVQAAVKALHLITAYSGYSKEYLNSNYNTNIRTTRLSVSSSSNQSQLLNKRLMKTAISTTSRKGCIGDDAWFIAKQPHADVLGMISSF